MAELGGDSESVHELATWVRDTLVPQVEACVSTLNSINRHRDPLAWDDDSSEVFFDDVLALAREADDFAGTIKKSATKIDGAAGALREAKKEMELAYQHARTGQLIVDDHGWIHHPVDGKSWEYPGSMPLEDQQRLEKERIDNYAAALECTESASSRIVKHMRLINEHKKTDWTAVIYFNSQGLAGGGLKELSQWFESKHLDAVERARESARSQQARADRYYERVRKIRFTSFREPLVNAGPLLTAGVHPTLAWADLRASLANAANLTARVFSKANYVIAVVAVGYDIYQGEDPGKAIFTGGFGLLGGAIASAGGGAIVAVFTPGPGWIVGGALIAGAIGSIVTGTVLAPPLYDHLTEKSPRELLMESGTPLGPRTPPRHNYPGPPR